MAVSILTTPAHAGWGSIGHAFKDAAHQLDVTADDNNIGQIADVGSSFDKVGDAMSTAFAGDWDGVYDPNENGVVDAGNTIGDADYNPIDWDGVGDDLENTNFHSTNEAFDNADWEGAGDAFDPAKNGTTDSFDNTGGIVDPDGNGIIYDH